MRRARCVHRHTWAAPPDEAALLAMHPKQVEELIESYRQNAVWQGTTETVRWYTKEIYGKLGVSSRTQAVARARQLALLPSDA